MAKNGAEVIICLILLITIGLLFVINKSLSASDLLKNPNPEYSWVIHGLQNILGYSTVFLPGCIVYRYIRKINYLDKTGTNCIGLLVRKCFGEDELIDRNSAVCANPQQPRTLLQDTFLLLFYFMGLQVSFLTWGVLQEKVMTQKYTNAQGSVGHFTDSQFLVFVNRILAFCMSGMVILCTRQPRHKSPLYKYVFCSFSNILSSWCQYEALKFVSFPHQIAKTICCKKVSGFVKVMILHSSREYNQQCWESWFLFLSSTLTIWGITTGVLAKAAKTIPVMIMGKLISRTKYEYYEYVAAVVLSVGMLFFMLDTESERKGSTVTTFSGVILLCSYIAFDSFTSNWQGALFKQYGMKPVQMMCAVNFFSCIFTAVSLLQQGGFVTSVKFMLEFPSFVIDCLLLSVCSAAGQLFIFRTIATFGPLVFAIITTIRQGFSVLLSCIIYQHRVYSLGIFGVILVFLSIFLRIYCSYRIKVMRKRAQSANNLKI